MVHHFIRDSFWGRIIYHLSQHKLISYPEEHPDYVIPEKYYGESIQKEEVLVEQQDSASSTPTASTSTLAVNSKRVIVDWEGDDDPENPVNWSVTEKCVFVFLVSFLTLSVYIGSAVYTPGVEEIKAQYNVDQTVATLPLSLFVVGYGTGSMFLSPLSENPKLGRTSIYIVTLFLFFILQIPTALVDNIPGLCILRFIGGLFASAALGTGGASVGDVVSLPYIPLGIATWALAAVCGPSLGPLIGAALVNRWNWRATFWFMAILTGACFLVLGFTLPESYGPTILYRRANRLRALTGNQDLITEGEIEQEKLTPSEIWTDLLWRPIEVIIFEPVVLLINLYISLLYSVMYLWFEAFPVVFTEVYGFGLVPMGVTFVSVEIGLIAGAFIYAPFIHRYFTVPRLNGVITPPEVFIPMSIVGSIIMPIGILLFGWTATESVHWIVCLIGAGMFVTGAFLVFQTLFNYLSFSFSKYLASVFGSNNLMRSNIAAFFPIIAQFLFGNLATKKFLVGKGSSILGGILILMIAIPVGFYLNGPKLRARSKYASIK